MNKTTINVIGRKRIYLSISGILALIAIISMLTFGFEQGIDFQGGTFWQFRVADSTSSTDVRVTMEELFPGQDIRISHNESAGEFSIRMPELGEAEHQTAQAELQSRFTDFEELSFQSIGPSIGEQLKQKSLMAVILVLAGISLYIAFAFRKVYRPISSLKYGLVTLVTLGHDVVITAGLLSILGRYKGVEIDGNFIVALLVIAGFSVHDTIVVFDRIRENILSRKAKSEFKEVVNSSVNQTMARSINTSLTLILVLVALMIFGPTPLWYFLLTLLVGVSLGVYSSIFVASPLLVLWQETSNKKSRAG